MRKTFLPSIVILVVLLGCQFFQTTPAQEEVTPLPAQSNVVPTTPSKPGKATLPTPTEPGQVPLPAPTEPVEGDLLTTRAGVSFSIATLKSYTPQAFSSAEWFLPIAMEILGNPEVIANMTAEQKSFLAMNGFVVMETGDKQFKDIRYRVSRVNGQPFFLTTDQAYHALHVTFNDLLETLEKETMKPAMAEVLKSVYEQLKEYGSAAAGSELAEDYALARAYLAVAIKLFDENAKLEPEMESRIAPQLQQIKAMSGAEESALIPGFKDDYGAYRPVGHYAGTPELESYFKGMTWLGRVSFKFKDAENPGLKPSRAPLLITLALRDAKIKEGKAFDVWAGVYEMLDFMVGPSDDPGPLEVYTMMVKVYGANPGPETMKDEASWQKFLAAVDQSLAAPKINSTFAQFSAGQQAERSWRFMGQRFTLDAFIFQNLIQDKVEKREFPSGLDVAAAFGSRAADKALEAAGETKYVNYPEQMKKMKDVVSSQPQDQWLNRFYTAWLYAFLPQAQAKGNEFPPFMRTEPWSYKDVNSILGSWAELKHDTVLYAKMPEGMGGGGPPMSGPAPAYVEPVPDVFYRLAYAARSIREGVTMRQSTWMSMGVPSNAPSDNSISLENYLNHLDQLATNLENFGDIAAKELQGTALTPIDFEAIQVCLEYKECMDRGNYSSFAPKQEPIPVVAAVSGWKDKVLEAGVGYLDRIYVVVPLEGKLEIAQGGVFRYYEFTQPRSDRLTDEAWRKKMDQSPPPRPAWSKAFALPGGKVNNVLAFRIGDIYYLSEKGIDPPLNFRAGPSRSAKILKKLDTQEYFEIIAGPEETAEGRWWKVRLAMTTEEEGWILENQEWYLRSFY